MNAATQSTKGSSAPNARAIWRDRLGRLYSGSAVLFWPITDVVMRVFIAIAYLRSGWVKAWDWEMALLLATEEYPVSWLSPFNAAVTGLTIELVAPVLLALGLFTRPAALALAVLTIVSQVVYVPTTTNLMLIAMLLWYLIAGSAAISLDALWVRKAGRREGGLVGWAVDVGAWTRKVLGPVAMLVLRLWLGVSFLAYAGLIDPPIWLATWLVSTSFTGTPDWLAIAFALLLITGTLASPVSYALTFLIAAFMVAGVHPDITFYPVLLFGVYEARGAGLLSVDRAVEQWLAKRSCGESKQMVDIDDPDQWFAMIGQIRTLGMQFTRRLRVKHR